MGRRTYSGIVVVIFLENRSDGFGDAGAVVCGAYEMSERRGGNKIRTKWGPDEEVFGIDIVEYKHSGIISKATYDERHDHAPRCVGKIDPSSLEEAGPPSQPPHG